MTFSPNLIPKLGFRVKLMFKIASSVLISRANNFFFVIFFNFLICFIPWLAFFYVIFFNFPICFIPWLVVSGGSLQTLAQPMGHRKRHFWSCKVDVGFEFMREKCFWVTGCALCMRRFCEKLFRFVPCVRSFFGL